MTYHWITASTQWCENCDVKVYDSVFSQLDETTLHIVKEMFGPIVEVVHTQKQMGSNDCGIFAIAFMTSLANQENPTVALYGQRLLRPHLVNCLANGNMNLFPKLRS